MGKSFEELRVRRSLLKVLEEIGFAELIPVAYIPEEVEIPETYKAISAYIF